MISRRLPARLLAVAACALAAGSLVTPSAAGAPAPAGETSARHWYLAVGDSVSTGLQPGSGTDRDGAFTGALLSPIQHDEPQTGLRNLACEVTETSTDMINGGDCSYEEGSQLAQALV